jgi:putative transposase
MFLISRATPACYFTCVTHHRLPIFRTEALKQVLCSAWTEAKERHNILIFAYVIMPDHVHLLASADREMADILRLLNGIAARRIIEHLRQNGHEGSLLKLRGGIRERNHRHSVWQHHADSLQIFGEDTFCQKVDYIHLNPVQAGLVNGPLEYRYSSARSWAGASDIEEPLVTDQNMIRWR